MLQLLHHLRRLRNRGYAITYVDGATDRRATYEAARAAVVARYPRAWVERRGEFTRDGLVTLYDAREDRALATITLR